MIIKAIFQFFVPVRYVLIGVLTMFSSLKDVNAQLSNVVDTTRAIENIERMLDDSKNLKRDGDYDLAYSTIDSAVTLSKSIDNKQLTSFALSELGVICMYQGRYAHALKYMHDGVQIREALKDSAGLAESYNFIASVHHAQTDYDIAIKYYRKSLEILKGIDDPKSLGILYNNLGSLYADRAEYEQALEYHNKSMNIWQEMADTSWISVSLRHIGVCYQYQGRIADALDEFMHSYEMSTKSGSRMNVIRSCMPIGDLYLAEGKPDEARKWCEEAYDLSVEGSNLYGIKESCWCLSEVYEGLGKHQQALEFYKRSITARDSIFGHERTKELTRLEMQFVFERQQLADSLMFVKQQVAQEKRIAGQQIGWASTAAVLLMIGALALVVYRGKRKSDHLLLNILPSEIAEELKEHGEIKAKLLESVTVMFTDFKGFTGVSERLTPEELVGEINACFSEFDHVMQKYGVEKIKTVGDAYMAAGGVPIQNTAHAKDVVKAALAIQLFMIERAKSRKEQGLEFFEMRVGVHTGPVVAGIVGVKKFQYDIWGDTVNTASRMESSGGVGKVNISQATYELLKNDADFRFESRGKIEAKGKGEMEMYYAYLSTI